ncbi:unnamed protein product [Oppiella nova]|uniref:BCL-11A-like CCHC zinc finger domain-containing protein n=1 Tax=Oppiella nova TaxID=334625 RepID=A0A7R9LAI5_9ACAR|nr:unnamed protein product [Oppiella nova]CAG2161390.1 unnamed protein product [Oppiella nova]
MTYKCLDQTNQGLKYASERVHWTRHHFRRRRLSQPPSEGLNQTVLHVNPSISYVRIYLFVREFALQDILKFISHKVNSCSNKENCRINAFNPSDDDLDDMDNELSISEDNPSETNDNNTNDTNVSPINVRKQTPNTIDSITIEVNQICSIVLHVRPIQVLLKVQIPVKSQLLLTRKHILLIQVPEFSCVEKMLRKVQIECCDETEPSGVRSIRAVTLDSPIHCEAPKNAVSNMSSAMQCNTNLYQFFKPMPNHF